MLHATIAIKTIINNDVANTIKKKLILTLKVIIIESNRLLISLLT